MGSNTIPDNSFSNANPPLPISHQKDTGETNTPKTSNASTTPPIIYPPVNTNDIPAFSRSLFKNYSPIMGDEDSLCREAAQLFEKVFLMEAPLDNDLKAWEAFYSQAKEALNLPNKIRAWLNLSQATMEKADKKLIFEYINNAPKEPSKEFCERFAYQYKSISNEYNGWQGNQFYTSADIFMGILNEYFGSSDFESLAAQLVRQNLQGFLVEISLPEAEKWLKTNEEEFFSFHNLIQKEYVNTAPGTKQKIQAFKRINDLNALSLARGISLSKIHYQEMVASLPNLTKEEYSAVFNLQSLANYRQIGDKAYFVQTFKYFTDAYFNQQTPFEAKSTYAKVLSHLDVYAKGFDLASSDLDKILTDSAIKNHQSLFGKGRIKNMEGLRNKQEVSPEGLPQEIKEILIRTGYWKLIKNKLKCIYFTSEINEGNGRYSMQAAGVAFLNLERIEIDTVNPDGSLVSALSIATTLVHEAAHMEWIKEDPVLQQSTPNERHAFSVQYNFLQVYKNAFGAPTTDADKKSLEDDIKQAKIAIETANLIMGYDKSDLSPDNKTLPGIEVCKKRGVSTSAELDLDFFPTFPAPDFLIAKSELVSLLKTLKINASPKAISYLWNILEGNITIEVIANFTQNTLAKDRPKLNYIYAGKKEPIKEERTIELAKMLKTLDNVAYPNESSSNDYEALILAGALIGEPNPKANEQQLTSRLSAASLREFLWDINFAKRF